MRREWKYLRKLLANQQNNAKCEEQIAMTRKNQASKKYMIKLSNETLPNTGVSNGGTDKSGR